MTEKWSSNQLEPESSEFGISLKRNACKSLGAAPGAFRPGLCKVRPEISFAEVGEGVSLAAFPFEWSSMGQGSEPSLSDHFHPVQVPRRGRRTRTNIQRALLELQLMGAAMSWERDARMRDTSESKISWSMYVHMLPSGSSPINTIEWLEVWRCAERVFLVRSDKSNTIESKLTGSEIRTTLQREGNLFS
jgi:hypothetical protein